MKANNPTATADASAAWWRGLHTHAWVYALLFCGALVFSWPFVWMFFTSLKTERELSAENARLLPDAPRPQARSPYIDAAWFAAPKTEAARALLPLVEARIREMNFPWPAGLTSEAAAPAVARGLVRKWQLSQPATWWQARTLWPAEIRQLVTPALVEEILGQVERSIVLGQFTARSEETQQETLLTGEQEALAWPPAGTAPAQFIPPLTRAPGGRMEYDLSGGGTVQLTRTFSTSFPINRLHSLKLYLRSDGSWNRINLVVEMNGRQLRSVHPVVLSTAGWSEISWQEYGSDDQSNKIRTWTLLAETARSPQFENDPNRIKVTLELAPTSVPRAWWDKLTLNYRQTLSYIPFGRYVATSLFVVILQLIGTLLSCSLTAYSFARLRWPGRRLCFLLMIATMIVPSQATMIPHFIIMRSLHWYNTLYPLWVPSFFANAFFVFLLCQFLRGLPRDLEDAARIDGCGYWRIYWHVILPLIRPSLAAIAIFTFVGAWNDFTSPLLYVSDQRLFPLAFGLYALNIQSGEAPGIMMAGSLLMTLPVITIFFLAQRYFIQGIALTGMK